MEAYMSGRVVSLLRRGRRDKGSGVHAGWYLEHRGGVVWPDAPLPAWRHDCVAQTRGFIQGEHVERCACGAIAFDGDGIWVRRSKDEVIDG
jgi:hypothetical protein